MPKQYNIRWGRSDYSKLSHLVRKVNKKVFAIDVKRPDIAGYQPAMLDYQEAKNEIKTRRDFNNFIKKYERYLREGAEEIIKSDRGAVASKWEVKEFEIAQRAENTRRRAEAKKLGEKEVTIAGKETGNKRAEMGKIRENANKQSKKKFKNQSQQEWEHAKRLFEQRMKSNYKEKEYLQMQRNYTKGLIAEGYPDELIKMMNNIDSKTFAQVFHTDEIATVDFIYDPIELKAKADLLLDFWSEYADENVDVGLDFETINNEIILEYENGQRIKGTGRIRQTRKRSRRR